MSKIQTYVQYTSNYFFQQDFKEKGIKKWTNLHVSWIASKYQHLLKPSYVQFQTSASGSLHSNVAPTPTNVDARCVALSYINDR